ncbi:type II secretion system protein GspN [Geobacter pickeringii]|uniref:Lipoprotein n=1 Tax=Geobacter pickeringii TaxID=345632 RepID=A0A0B5BDF6_9BACT|nr:type II secretion system protein GspN [Geobacter pickeringii]AJE02116.1 lipoprotein [Geobacter pickeringii]
MTPRRVLLTAGGVVAATALTLFFTYLLIPSRELEGVVTRLLAREGYTFRAARFGKAFPFGVSAGGVTIAGARGDLLRLDRATARLSLLSLLAGRVTVPFAAEIGAGRIRGEVSPRSGASRVTITGVRLQDVPFFRSVADADAKGLLTAEITVRGSGPAAAGSLKLEVKGADLRGVKIGETPLPDAGYDTVRGMIRLGGGRAAIDSFTLQGSELYVRLKGEFPLTTPVGAAPLNLTLELMPKPGLLDRQKLVFALLTKYLVTPGHYQMPIRGVLAKPLLQ